MSPRVKVKERTEGALAKFQRDFEIMENRSTVLRTNVRRLRGKLLGIGEARGDVLKESE